MRSVYRGDKVRFEQEFRDGSTVLVPRDATWPKYSIKDPSGVQVQTGTGTVLAGGKYRAEWLVMRNAPLTMDNPQQNWLIEWTFVDEDAKFYTFTENFIVLDDVKIEETSREQKFIALANTEYVPKLQMTMDPYDISLKIVHIADESTVTELSKTDLVKRGNPDSGLISYEGKVTLGGPGCDFMCLWQITDSSTSTPRFQYQVVRSVGPRLLAMVPEVRILIDKFQKVAGTIQAFEDSDIIDYLDKGSQRINAAYPTTFWEPTMPGSPLLVSPLHYFTIMCAAWYGLTAQHLLENDLAFNFNGLTTTLDVDRTSGIESAIGRMNDHIDKALPAAKMTVFRKLNGAGHVGTRIFGRRPTMENISYKIGTMNTSGILDYFSKMGIFYP